MKLRNKETGEIRDARIEGEHLQLWSTDLEKWFDYDDLEYLAEWWERYESPKEYWFIDSGGEVGETTYLTDRDRTNLRNFGNYFTTKEEAEKAVEKLKAWKRLRDKGFKFEWWLSEPSGNHIEFYMDGFEWDKEATKDLNLLFGGEE